MNWLGSHCIRVQKLCIKAIPVPNSHDDVCHLTMVCAAVFYSKNEPRQCHRAEASGSLRSRSCLHSELLQQFHFPLKQKKSAILYQWTKSHSTTLGNHSSIRELSSSSSRTQNHCENRWTSDGDSTDRVCLLHNGETFKAGVGVTLWTPSRRRRSEAADYHCPIQVRGDRCWGGGKLDLILRHTNSFLEIKQKDCHQKLKQTNPTHRIDRESNWLMWCRWKFLSHLYSLLDYVWNETH